ncbi:inhibitory synaptic factor 2A-like [Oncorhynchus keta]|uniref:inhibitory synaptic factor 2A-like n=1 Tax=Oncorhynchus keta TaxID=8018 RepID=UPI00227D69ED|nr:inhibitory synaptic factor 2A-like [Oncorhynchus keta]
MVSKAEGDKSMLTNSESDSEVAPTPSPSASLALEVKYSFLDTSSRSQQQVRKRNKALQVRFKDICEAQNEQREAALQMAGKGGKPGSYKVAYRKYMTVPARRSIPNVTKSTGVQTSPDLRSRYKTFPMERKKGHSHTKHVERDKGHNNGFVIDVKHSRAVESLGDRGACGGGGGGQRTRAVESLGDRGACGGGGGGQRTRAVESLGDRGACGGGGGVVQRTRAVESLGDRGACGGGGGGVVQRTRALMHTTECIATVEKHCTDDVLYSDCLMLTDGPSPSNTPDSNPPATDYQICSVESNPLEGLEHRELDSSDRPAGKRQLLHSEEPGSSRTLPGDMRGSSSVSKVTGPISWNSLTQVECLESPTARSKRMKGLEINGLQSQTLPRAAGCTTQAQCHEPATFSSQTFSPQTLSARTTGEALGCRSSGVEPATVATTGGVNPGGVCKQIVPVLTQKGEGGEDVKSQLQAMENLISSSQETIKVLLGVIQELEKGEAHREGLSYRTGQDTANCDTCRNSACIIYR